MDNAIDELLESYEKTIVKEIRSYRDNIQYFENEADQKLVQKIIDTKKLPIDISQQTVSVINKLFKEIEVVEVDQEQIINTLFPSHEMTTLEELRKRFFSLEAGLKQDKQESEVRIKLK